MAFIFLISARVQCFVMSEVLSNEQLVVVSACEVNVLLALQEVFYASAGYCQCKIKTGLGSCGGAELPAAPNVSRAGQSVQSERHPAEKIRRACWVIKH